MLGLTFTSECNKNMHKGLVEALGGILMLIPSIRGYGSLLTIATLIAVYPANIYMAMSSDVRKKLKIPLGGTLFRLPLQFVMIGMAYIAVPSDELGATFDALKSKMV